MKMAEVSQRLGNGAYRLSAVRNTHSRPVFGGEHCTSTGARTCGVGKEETTAPPGICEYQPAAQRKAEKRYRLRKRKTRQENWILPCVTSWDLAAYPISSLVQTRETIQAGETGVYLSPAPSLPRANLLVGRMTCWSKRRVFPAATIHPETSRSPQQLREFCTIMITLAERGSESLGNGLRLCLKRHPDALQLSTTTRCYSWRGNNSKRDAPPLYRSKTAYYDILKVSPSATQSQIKTAYYKQSFINHPDKNPGNDEATQCFSEISEAYTVLGNISLRRKYDRGILTQSDVQGAGRPSSREATGRASGSQQQQQQKQQQRVRRFSPDGGKPMFDFDAFFQAHYGEQLQREREMRARKQQLQEKQRTRLKTWKRDRMVEMTVGILLAMAGVIFVSIGRK